MPAFKRIPGTLFCVDAFQYSLPRAPLAPLAGGRSKPFNAAAPPRRHAVGNIDAGPAGAGAHFLSHFHSDHYGGLTSKVGRRGRGEG